jgi:hypothetical protein
MVAVTARGVGEPDRKCRPEPLRIMDADAPGSHRAGDLGVVRDVRRSLANQGSPSSSMNAEAAIFPHV